MRKHVTIKLSVLTFLFVLIVSGPGTAGVPLVSRLETTDVTPGSFAATWVVSEPSAGALTVYAADCTTPVTGLEIASEGSDKTYVIRVTASGLSADTTYCYRTSSTSKSTSETTPYPPVPVTVTTAKAVLRTMITGTAGVPFANDVLRVPDVYLQTDTDTPDGGLAVLYLEGGRGPISLLLTNDDKTRYFNMNNLFGAATGESMNLSGGERVTISERHGKSGCVIERFRKVPGDQEMTTARDFVASSKRQDVDFNGTVNILDILRVAGAMGTAKGDTCFNRELDMIGHDKVDRSDLDSAIGNFDARP